MSNSLNIDKEAIEHFLSIAQKITYISDISSITELEDGRASIDICFEVNFPSHYRTEDKTPVGVKKHEPVKFIFNHNFPHSPPSFYLRKDFNTNFPHLTIDESGNLIPCICENRIDEFYMQRGIEGILFQMFTWLSNAASDSLINRTQGWEPMRRDGLVNTCIEANSNNLSRIADDQKGFYFFQTHVIKMNDNTESFIQIFSNTSVDQNNIGQKLFLRYSNNGIVNQYCSLAITIHCTNLTDKIKENNNIYKPDKVKNFCDLLESAEFHGLDENLLIAIKMLEAAVEKNSNGINIIVPVIFLIRRDCEIIGSTGDIEICSYVMHINSKSSFEGILTNINKKRNIRVSPAAHVESVNTELLAQMSGQTKKETFTPWIMFGAGSLGSKIALHIGRAGAGPSIIVDNATMFPHNLARHAIFFKGLKKAELVKAAINQLGQNSKAVCENIVDILDSKEKINDLYHDPPKFIVNTTASLVTRNAINKCPYLPCKVVDASLFVGGKIGLLLAEGKDRNPRLNDLLLEFYRIASDDDALSDLLFRQQDSEGRQIIGQGCGSYSIVMSDGRLLLMAAGMSEYMVRNCEELIKPPKGKILIGRLADDEISVKWKCYSMPEVKIISTDVISEHHNDWRVRIHTFALDKINKEYKRCPDVETGGLLLGSMSLSERTFNVVDVMEAPPDSERKADKFVLGESASRINCYLRRTNGALYPLGTWHSHLGDNTPSPIDIETAKKISEKQTQPSLLLIRGNNGYKAIMG